MRNKRMNQYATMSNKHKGVLDITISETTHGVNIKGATTGVKVKLGLDSLWWGCYTLIVNRQAYITRRLI